MTVNNTRVKVIRKKIKNLHLAVCPPDGWVRIAVPEMIDDEAVRLAVLSKQAWIKRQQKIFCEQARQSSREFISGESHYYLGRRYRLAVCHTTARPFVEVKNKKHIILHISANATRAQRQGLLIAWYRQEMKKILLPLIAKWEGKSGLAVADYGIKRMKTRWGSCNPRAQRIWLNLELIKKPIQCLEYVVVHEMVHFLERTHNDNFVAHMNRLLPQWRACQDDLNRAPLAHEDWKY